MRRSGSASLVPDSPSRLSGVPTSPSSPAAGRTRSSSALRDDLLQAQTEAGAERRWDSDESIVGDMPPSLEEHAILSRIHQLHREWEERRSESARGASSPESSAAAASKGEAQQERLVIVSNRLPVKVVRDPKTNEWNFRVTSGGLVTALSGMRGSMDFVWIGWLECDMPAEEQPAFAQRLLAEHGCLPVFLPKEVSDGFYNGFSNDVLWPLFHYVPLVVHVEGASEAKSFNPQHWAAYQRANRMFADVVTPLLREGDMVWVHDYHLTLLPRLLKELGPPSLTIGWFLHIPWPTSEVYRYLPVKTEILEGLLHADLVGFHTYDYARHFQSCCRRFLSARCVPRGIEYGGQVIDLGVFPIGIDPEGFESRVREPATQSRLMELINGHKLKGKQVFLSVGRVDYIKGVPHRLAAFNLFLQRYPQYWQEERVVLIEIAIPTRQDVLEFRLLANQCHEMVGTINGAFSSISYQPIQWMYHGVTPVELAALYNIADALIVSSLRDGMNLTALEYVACQQEACPSREGPGVLLLSEFAGAAQSLISAVRVNPWNTDELADAMHHALTMPCAERRKRHASMYRHVREHTSIEWGKNYVDALKRTATRREAASTKALKMQPLPVPLLFSAFTKAKRRLIMCTYEDVLETHWATATLKWRRDGSGGVPDDEEEENKVDGAESSSDSRVRALTSSSTDGSNPDLRDARYNNAKSARVPSRSRDSMRPPRSLKACLIALAADAKNTVVLVSERSRSRLEAWFSASDSGGEEASLIGLASENGQFLRLPFVTTLGETGEWQCLGSDPAATAAMAEPAGTGVTSPRGGTDSAQRRLLRRETQAFSGAEVVAHSGWKSIVRETMHFYTERTAGSLLLERETTLVWNFEGADYEFAQSQARDLRIELQTVVNDFALTVRETAFTVSVQPDSAGDKGRLVDAVLSGVREQHKGNPCDFVFFCGSLGIDRTGFRRLAELDAAKRETSKGAGGDGSSEEPPAVLTADAAMFACRVGVELDDDDESVAPFCIESPQETRAILRRMLWASPGASSRSPGSPRTVRDDR